MQAASGPSRIAMSVPPTACPVVPPGSGTLNIIATNEKAAPTPIMETFSFGSSVLTFLTEWIHTGTMAAVITAQVEGLR